MRVCAFGKLNSGISASGIGHMCVFGLQIHVFFLCAFSARSPDVAVLPSDKFNSCVFRAEPRLGRAAVRQVEFRYFDVQHRHTSVFGLQIRVFLVCAFSARSPGLSVRPSDQFSSGILTSDVGHKSVFGFQIRVFVVCAFSARSPDLAWRSSLRVSSGILTPDICHMSVFVLLARVLFGLRVFRAEPRLGPAAVRQVNSGVLTSDICHMKVFRLQIRVALWARALVT